MHRRLLSAAATSALLLGLAACGEPTDGPVTTAPPSIDIGTPSDGGGDAEPSDGGGEPTDQPRAEAPDIPAPDPANFAGMDEHTPEGAEQAFRYYIAVSMWAHQTGVTDELAKLQAPTCSGCDDLNQDLADLHEHGQYWSEFTINNVDTTLHQSTKYEHEVGYFFSITPHTRPDEDFTGRIEAPQIEYITVGGMDWVDGQWIVGGLDAEWGTNKHA
ncbi:hypothetical protein CFK38_13490 [Brachybacterium vulturis]|uniref:DUF6318 domain-containing protein n=1 Tax=Brachybacterium vulturis TaxID=2017484 RepID=A0A291GPY2_9MICO|nr:DUF6318 family protein [Brachybacterium vulturis]ATG52419.1 hypothetical protein CFK38_13490 [Brachybacterium vulturis]